MPILASCAACKAQYKIVDNAAGRRVRCRQCGAAFYVPGEPKNVRPAISSAALAELEKTGRREEDDRQAFFRYQATLSTLPHSSVSLKPTSSAPKHSLFGRVASWLMRGD